ncbi:MAG: glycosyltransferase family 4 protein [Anaerolineae bacterium]|nr:glycosyltransferase family 4 protein [Anaerolineae bacterium]
MHIGIVHYAAPPVVGGVELTIFHHARILTQLGHKVTVVAGRGDAVQPGVVYKDEPLAGSRGEAVSRVTSALAAGEVPADFDALVQQTKTALLDHLGDCDVVIGHNFFTLHKNQLLTTAVYELTQQQQGPPWVAWHHDFAWLRPQYESELYPHAPWTLLKEPWPGICHVTVSEAQKVDLARLYDIPLEQITVVSPGVDPIEFLRCNDKVAQLIQDWALFEADCVFLLPARITRRKNIELGLKWLAEVRALSGWDARLVITGPPGPHNPTNAAYLNDLLALRNELNVENAVHFVYQAKGPDQQLLLDDAELATLYQVADAMFFPSRQEGFGIPILEAGLVRLPIFATDLPPFRESAADKAMLFPLDTPPSQVAAAIYSALQNDRAFQLRRRMITQFTWLGIVKNTILPLLEQVASGN